MGERFLAFLCDASVQTALLVGLVAAYYANSSLQLEGFKEMAAWIIPPAYMILSETLFHGTIGKRLLGLQLRADYDEVRYPSLFQILARETVGKFLSAVILGIGFLAGIDHPRRKTWADRLASTVVVRTRIVSPQFKAVLIPVLLCAYFVIGIVLKDAYTTHSTQLKYQLTALESRIDILHQKIFLSFLPIDPGPAMSYKQSITTLLPLIDEYDRLLLRQQVIVAKSRGLVQVAPSGELRRLDSYVTVIRLRQETVRLVRQHARMALAYDPQSQKWDDVLSDRREMIRGIRARNAQINQIGRIFIPGTIAFTDDGD
jgi:uncharacterized RDD family membrane protein YckC